MDDQKFKCPSHPDKPSAFYCFAHSTTACLKCVAEHIQCQVENQFQPLEEVYESVQNNAIAENEFLEEKIARSSETINEDQNKFMMLDNLRDLDMQAIGDCFEDLKKRIDTMKEKTLENYREYYGSIREKVENNNERNQKQLEKEKDAKEKVKRLQERLHQEGSTVEEKRGRAMELWRELEKVKEDTREPFEFEKVDQELESLMNREEVFSVIEKMTLQYSRIPSHVSNFMKEYMKEYFTEPEEYVKQEGFGAGSLDERIRNIDYLKEQRQVYDENFLKALEEPVGAGKNLNKRLHQLRYCSNEINIFDCVTEKFSSYELYTTNSFKAPFFIFNNCGSVIYKNHLIFLFGGEDPAANDKSSNRVFCVNLNKAMNNKVVAYEICPMTMARQEFTLTTVGHNIYAISGYDSNRPKENRVIPKCERLDVRAKKFCDMRNIDYPRQAACSVNVNNTHIYVFGGQNPKYLNYYVDKIERYTINLDDWSSLKYSVMNEFLYEPGMNSSAFRLNDGEIMILGGKRDQELLNGYFVFDMKKLLIVKKEEKLFKEADNFYNQNNVELDNQKRIQLFSSNKANYVYELALKDAASYTLSVNIIQDHESQLIH